MFLVAMVMEKVLGKTNVTPLDFCRLVQSCFSLPKD